MNIPKSNYSGMSDNPKLERLFNSCLAYISRQTGSVPEIDVTELEPGKYQIIDYTKGKFDFVLPCFVHHSTHRSPRPCAYIEDDKSIIVTNLDDFCTMLEGCTFMRKSKEMSDIKEIKAYEDSEGKQYFTLQEAKDAQALIYSRNLIDEHMSYEDYKQETFLFFKEHLDKIRKAISDE